MYKHTICTRDLTFELLQHFLFINQLDAEGYFASYVLVTLS